MSDGPTDVLNLPRLDLAVNDIESVQQCCTDFRDVYARLRATVATVIVGQDEVVDLVLTALFADGHVLLEGVPGLGKTLLVRTLADALSLPFARIQFTPDVMPADITGTSVVMEDRASGHREFVFRPGPIFHQLVLADEINRATPKSQSALLEAMQERSVTIAGKTRDLGRPFLVMATQNPIEQEGTYPLPEAQLDRFLFKVHVPNVNRPELNDIVHRTTRGGQAIVKPVLDQPYILAAQKLARRIVIAPHVQDYVVRLILATHPGNPHADPEFDHYIHVGASPRAAQAIVSAAKVRALVDGRFAVSFGDLVAVAPSALRHRILVSFEAQAESVTSDTVVQHLLEYVPRDGDLTPAAEGERSRHG